MKVKLMAATVAAAVLAAGVSFGRGLDEVIKLAPNVETLKFGGDLRMREEFFDYMDSKSSLATPANAGDRLRSRYRLRLKTEFALQQYLNVTAGLASGTGEAVSTNQTFGALGKQKDIWIDIAQMSWNPPVFGEAGGIGVIAGRMVNPLWRVYSSDVLWDGDYNPEGLGQQASYAPIDGVRVFANALQMVADEDNRNPRGQWCLSGQVGVEAELPFYTKLTVAGAYHNWMRTGSSTLNQSPAQLGNTRNAAGILLNDYGVLEGTGQLASYLPLPVVDFKLPVTLMGTVIKNELARGPDFEGTTGGTALVSGANSSFPRKSDQGFQVGGVLGRAKDPGTFEIAYFYKRAGWNSTVADVVDSDFGDGGLNRKGNIGWIAYTPNGWLTVTVKGFNVRLLDKRYVTNSAGKLTVNDKINRVQADVAIKF